MSEETKNTLKAEAGDWDEDFSDGNEESSQNESKNNITWMKFDAPGTYRIRLVGKFVTFRRHWKPFKSKVITSKEWKDEDPAWQAGFYPKKTCAIHIIDRNDGKLKILEKGYRFFQDFANFKQTNGINPAGKEAPDFQIKVSWPKGNKLSAKYQIQSLMEKNKLTDEELQMVKSSMADLGELYKATPLEKIKELWAAIPEEQKVKENNQSPNNDSSNNDLSNNQSSSSNSNSENFEENSGDGDDLFEGSGGGDDSDGGLGF